MQSTPDIAEMYLGGASIPDITKETGIPMSTVRHRLITDGVPLRTRAEGVRGAADKISAALLGRKRPPFTDAHRAAISAAKLAHGEEYAVGTRITSEGYVEYTRGPHKGRSVHVVRMEQRLGRHLYRDEVVHHIDEDRQNNDDNNLALMTRSGHTRHHRLAERATNNKDAA